jgi:hypothetical protein
MMTTPHSRLPSSRDSIALISECSVLVEHWKEELISENRSMIGTDLGSYAKKQLVNLCTKKDSGET